MTIFEFLWYLIFCMAIGYCLGISIAYGKNEGEALPIISGIVGFIGLMYFIWR